ncbi:MAG: helix-turn-helix domain-containing protein [Parasporobacterium sp.]|nr:helix-turn-helix domain-containing protein [Parasporobacterium sp.]
MSDILEKYLPLTPREQLIKSAVMCRDLSFSGLPELLPVDIMNMDAQSPDPTKMMPEYEHVGLFIQWRYQPFTLHCHDFIEIKYLAFGELDIPVNDQIVHLIPGDFLFINPQVYHCVQVNNDDTLLINVFIKTDSVSVCFPRLMGSSNFIAKFLLSDTDSCNNSGFFICHTGMDAELRNLLETIYSHQHIDNNSRILCQIKETLFEGLLLKLVCDYSDNVEISGQGARLPRQLLEIIDYMNSNYLTATFDELAERFHYSPSHLSKILKKHTGHTFSEFISSARMAQAANLLLNTSLSVPDIIDECGYSGRTNFYNQFRKKYKMSPADYRRQNT